MRGRRKVVPSINDLIPRVDDPACGWLADNLAQAQRAIALGEVFSVGEGMLVSDEDRRTIERALAQHRARGRAAQTAQGHRQITPSREHIDRVDIHKPATVVANIDHYAVFPVVLGVEIDVQLVERGWSTCQTCARTRAGHCSPSPHTGDSFSTHCL